jgi:hypothetical protein
LNPRIILKGRFRLTTRQRKRLIPHWWEDAYLNRGNNDDEEEDGSQFVHKSPFSNKVTPKMKPRNSQSNKGRITIGDNPAIGKLYNLVTSNPHDFNVTKLGYILNNQGQPIIDSNLLGSISRFFSPRLGEASPKGTQLLKNSITKDPVAKQIYDKGMAYSHSQMYEKNKKQAKCNPYDVKLW